MKHLKAIITCTCFITFILIGFSKADSNNNDDIYLDEIKYYVSQDNEEDLPPPSFPEPNSPFPGKNY